MSKSTPDSPALPDPAALSYEQAVEELEAIIDQIESGEIGLEDSVKAYERGMQLRKRCEEVLKQAEQRVEELGESEGSGDG